MNQKTRLHFIQVGLQTTVQDVGRYGAQNEGIPIGGVLDRRSMVLANTCVGNDVANPVLEICLIGPKIQFDGECQLALCGADLSASVNGQSILRNERIDIQSGDILSFGQSVEGCRVYLAIRGEWNVKPWKGSVSAATHRGEILTPDSQFEKGDSLEVFPSFSSHSKMPMISTAITSRTIRVVPGPEFEDFPEEFIRSFFSVTHSVKVDSNRMGIRLENDCKLERRMEPLISSGVVPGTIQITETGKAIVLMMDAQTVGGYHRFINVIDSDLSFLAQAKPGDEIRFLLENYS